MCGSVLYFKGVSNTKAIFRTVLNINKRQKRQTRQGLPFYFLSVLEQNA